VRTPSGRNFRRIRRPPRPPTCRRRLAGGRQVLIAWRCR
jgi:hypothetical protein